MECLEFAATHNNFCFKDQFVRQDRGVAMGVKFAPSLANLFIAQWEKDAIYAQQRPQIVLWVRYIDDILLLWDGSEADLSEFST